MTRHVLVTLLKRVVLLHVMQIAPPDDNVPVHLEFDDNTRQDLATDGNIAGEGALLVDVVTFASLFSKRASFKFLFYDHFRGNSLGPLVTKANTK